MSFMLSTPQPPGTPTHFVSAWTNAPNTTYSYARDVESDNKFNGILQ